jgi:hypothetical protein
VPYVSSPELKSLWRIIRAVRQHDLDVKHTGLEMTVYNQYKCNYCNGCGYFGVQDFRLQSEELQYDQLLRLRGDLTEGLLQYIPRRSSKRGAA